MSDAEAIVATLISSNTQSEIQDLAWAKQKVAKAKALQDYKHAAQQEASRQQQANQPPSPAHVAKMQQWLNSGDPILAAEAEAFFNYCQIE